MFKTALSRWMFFIAVTLIGFGADWYSKDQAVKHLPYARPVNIIGEHFQLCLVYNKAALWGLDPRTVIPGFPLNKFFMVFSIIAMAALILYYRSVKSQNAWLLCAIACIMPGAVGNFWDRIIRPGDGVVDFIKIGISQDVYWPIFNFADIYVSAGVIMLLIQFVVEEVQLHKAKKAASLPVQNG